MKKLGVIILSLFATACCVIDDDLSVCDVDFVINYALELRADITTQLETELNEEADSTARKAIAQWLEPIFTDHVKDVDLRFFLSQTDELAYLIKEEVNDNKTSYTIQLPKENYMHLGVANIVDNRQVQLSGEEHSGTMWVKTNNGDKLPSMNTGVFSARLPMEVHDSISQSFTVHLYMVNAAVALVLDPSDCADIVSINGLMAGAADGFAVCDSAYAYNRDYYVIMDRVEEKQPQKAPQPTPTQIMETKPRLCLGAVALPTRNGKKWYLTTTSVLTDNRRTTTTLTFYEPLKAGELKIVKCKIGEGGEVKPADSDVGVSIELDWKQGGDHNIAL